MKRMIFPILLATLIFTLGFALADTEKIVVSPTFTEYLYTDIHQTDAGFTFVDASVGQYIQDSKYGDMLVVSASISVDYDQVERNPVLFWNLYINGENLGEVPIFKELPNVGSNRKDVNYYADISFEGMIEQAMLVPVGNDQQEIKKEAVIIIDDSSDLDQFSLETDEFSQTQDLSEAFGYAEGDSYRNPFLGFDIIWSEAEIKLPPNESSKSTLISNFKKSPSAGMTLMVLRDANENGLSLELYHHDFDMKIEPALSNRDDNYRAVLLDRLVYELNEDESNLPVLPGKIQKTDFLGKDAYWIPVDYYWHGVRQYGIGIQCDYKNCRLLIFGHFTSPVELKDVLSHFENRKMSK